jgi:predicted transposase/invertase (TIGR01784 family)
MGHDQRFKEFLHAFLRDFLKLFYPRVEKRLEFENVEFLDSEVFTELHDGSRREADVVAKLRTRDGNPELVLIHVEIQLRPQRDVNERMFEYYSLLR